MASSSMEDTLSRVETLAHAVSLSMDSKMQQYDEWAPFYQQDMVNLDYRAPYFGTNMLRENLNSIDSPPNCIRVIDFAAGTGLVGRHLKTFGIELQIDAQDGSNRMLQVAQESNIYKNFFHCLILPGVPMPKIKKSFYDVGIICGALSDSQVDPGCLQVMLEHVRAGGLFIFTTRSNRSNLAYKANLDAVVLRLIDEGAWMKIATENIQDFEKATSSDETTSIDGNTIYISGTVYCYKRIK